MTHQPQCPSANELKQFVLGEASEPEAQRVGTHLSVCPQCLETLNDLRVEDTLVIAMRAQGAEYHDAEPEHIASLIARLRDIRRLTREGSENVAIDALQTEVHGTPAGTRDPERPVGVRSDLEAESCDFLSPAQRPDELGRLGPYRVLGVLGSGGMGIVFLAEDTQLERRVALKVMKPALAASESAKKRFLREARAAAALQNDHVVAIYQVSEDRGLPYLSMQLLDGESLEDRLRSIETQRTSSGSFMPVSDVLKIARETAEGLAAAHDHGLVHRDIKPANIFLSIVGRQSPGAQTAAGSETARSDAAFRSRVKLLDFGLARGVDEQSALTQAGAIAGTPAYMSPEQAKGEPVDHRCDLFSLGCVLYRMCTGQQAFAGSNNLAVLLGVIERAPTPLRELNPNVPQALADLVMQLLDKRREGRPDSAHAVLQAIDRIQLQFPADGSNVAGDLAAASRGLPPASPLPTVPTRRGTYAFAAVVAALLLGAVAVQTYRILTDKGTLVVEINDEQVEAKLQKDGLVLTDKSSGNNYRIGITLGETQKAERSGKYSLAAPGGLKLEVSDSNGAQLSATDFQLARGGKVRVKVTAEPPSGPVANQPANSPREIIARARALHAVGRLSEAIAACNEALKIDPAFAEALLVRGSARYQSGNAPEAVADYNRAIELDPTIAAAYLHLGCVYRDRGQFADAYAQMNRALEISPDLMNGWAELGWTHAIQGDYENALANLGEELRRFPLNAYAYLSRAGVYAKTGDLEKAKADHDRAIALDPNMAHISIALPDPADPNKSNAGSDPTHSTADFRTTMSSTIHSLSSNAFAAPSAVDSQLSSLLSRARALLFAMRPAEAMEISNEATRLAPSSAEAWMYLACAHRLRGEVAEALANAKKAVEADLRFAPGYVELSCIYRDMGQYDDAIAAATKALDLAPGIQRARGIRGWTYALKGDFEKALVDYDAEIRRFPLEASEYLYRAAIHARKGDFDAAKADRDRAIKLDPAQADVSISIGDPSTHILGNAVIRSPGETIHAQAPQTDLPSDKIAWGRPSAKGMQLGFDLEPRKPNYAMGERVKIRLFLRNLDQAAIHTTLPRLEVLEKFGLDLLLQDDQGKELGWSWGKSHKPRNLWTVSGGLALVLAPGKTHELPSTQVAIGLGSKIDDVIARLNVEPNQACRFRLKLETYGYAKGEGEPLESGLIEFRVVPD